MSARRWSITTTSYADEPSETKDSCFSVPPFSHSNPFYKLLLTEKNIIYLLKISYLEYRTVYVRGSHIWSNVSAFVMLKSQTNRTFDVFRAFEYDKGTKEAD